MEIKKNYNFLLENRISISTAGVKSSISQLLTNEIKKLRNEWNEYSFDEERCFIKFYGVENFITEIDNYDDSQIKRKRKTDRSLEALGEPSLLDPNNSLDSCVV